MPQLSYYAKIAKLPRSVCVERCTKSRTNDSARIHKPYRRKTELVHALMEHLDANEMECSKHEDLHDYFCRRKTCGQWLILPLSQFKTAILEHVTSAGGMGVIQAILILYEAIGLQWNTLKTTRAMLGLQATPLYAWTCYIHTPDVGILLTKGWWAPATLWLLTSFILPFVFSRYVNLTSHWDSKRESAYRLYLNDPLIFNIVKIILVYNIYGLPAMNTGVENETSITSDVASTWRVFFEQNSDVVISNVPGGYSGLLTRAFLGIGLSLYGMIGKMHATYMLEGAYSRNVPVSMIG